MKKRTKAVLTIFFLSLLFFAEINVEVRSAGNVTSYLAKRGAFFVQEVWMEQKEIFDASLYRSVLRTKDMKQKKGNEERFLQQYIPFAQWLTGSFLWSMCSAWAIPDIIGIQKRKVWYHQMRMEIMHLGDGKSRILMSR